MYIHSTKDRKASYISEKIVISIFYTDLFFISTAYTRMVTYVCTFMCNKHTTTPHIMYVRMYVCTYTPVDKTHTHAHRTIVNIVRCTYCKIIIDCTNKQRTIVYTYNEQRTHKFYLHTEHSTQYTQYTQYTHRTHVQNTHFHIDR